MDRYQSSRFNGLSNRSRDQKSTSVVPKNGDSLAFSKARAVTNFFEGTRKKVEIIFSSRVTVCRLGQRGFSNTVRSRAKETNCSNRHSSSVLNKTLFGTTRV